METRPLRRALWVTTSVLLMAGLIAAGITAGDDGRGSHLAADGVTTTTGRAAAPGASSGDGGDAGRVPDSSGTATSSTPSPGRSAAPTTAPSKSGSGAPTTPGGTSATTAATAGADAGTRTDDKPKPVAPPRPGAYRYKHTHDGETTEVTTRIEDRGAAPGGGRSLAVSQTEQGGEFVHDVTWGPAEIRITKTTIIAGSLRGECDWSPDYLEGIVDIRAGGQWSADSSCTAQFGTGVPVTRSSTVKVVESRRVHVAGTDLVVWVLDVHERFSFGDDPIESTGTQWFAPERGLVVRQSATYTTNERTWQDELEIVSLDPS